MSDSAFHFSLARIVATQVLRSAGIDRARLSVVDATTDILIRYILLLAETASAGAHVAGRHSCEAEDVRVAMEALGQLKNHSRLNYDGEENDGAVVAFVQWCRGPTTREMRRIAGEGVAEFEGFETSSADWLSSG